MVHDSLQMGPAECGRLFQKHSNLPCPAFKSTALLAALTQPQAPCKQDGISSSVAAAGGGKEKAVSSWVINVSGCH